MKRIFSICCLYLATVSAIEFSPLLEIQQGKLRGALKHDWKGGLFYSFLSIPFAKKPIGKLRFMDPEPPRKWDAVYDAIADMPECLQKDLKGNIIGKEDCLYLNVHTPEVVTKNLKSVMVFIHGGGYVEGTGRSDTLGAEFLIPEGVVVVTIQYRLGLFGFLNFENANVGVHGNMGLKDQNMALRWVQQNIEKFGGDPKSVTIFGESAGAASVHMHMISPMSQGLFHKVIAQSGAAICPWNTNGERNTGVLAAETLDFDGKSETDMLSFLQDTSIENIFKVQEKVSIIIPIHEPFLAGPVVETNSDQNSFLPNTPAKLLARNNYEEVPIMFGLTDSEAILMDAVSLLKTGKLLDLDPRTTLPHTLNIQSEKTKEEVIEKIFKFYYRDPNNFDRTDLIHHASDAWLNICTLKSAIEHEKLGNKNVYTYVMTADTGLNTFKRLHPITAKYEGCSHLDDLGYLFKSKLTPEVKPDSLEAKAIERIVKLWTNFAKYGNPTPENCGLNVSWKPIEESNDDILNIGTRGLKMHGNPFKERIDFWDDLHEYVNKKIVHTEL